MRAPLAAAAAALLFGVAAGAIGGYAAGHDPEPVAAPSPSASPVPSATPSPTPTPTPSASAGPCQDAQTQLDLNACAARERQQAEALLDRAYRAVLARSEGAARDALERSQRDWRRAADTLCGAQAGQGSIGPMNAAFCLADAARDRAADVCVWFSPNADADLPPECRDFVPEDEGT
ncbi:MAG TPA: lysozyme inhibitor LprI family protein [Mycobacteriales bacterium]